MKNVYILWLVVSCCLISLHTRAQSDIGATVRISSFNVSNKAREVKLQWTVACGLPFAYFEIQRSNDGQFFSTIHTFRADRIRCQSPFEYIDSIEANENYYRIRVGDADGKFTQEKIQFISKQKLPFTTVSVVNPASGKALLLNFIANKSTQLNLQLLTANGVVVDRTRMAIPAGYSSSSWQVTNMPSGIYYLGYSNSTLQAVTRFVKIF